VAYLRSKVRSGSNQEALLELGSDDGVVVWLNGEKVHEATPARSLQRAQDSVKVALKEGENVLLLKISQGGGDWEACARFRGLDGEHLSDVQPCKLSEDASK